MAAIPVSSPSRGAGTDFANTSAVWTTATMAGDTFAPGPSNYLFVRSTNPGNVTVTVTPSAGSGPAGTTIAPLPLAPVVGASGTRVYGPFPVIPFADTSDGQVHVSYTTASAGTLYVAVTVLNLSGS